MKFLFHGDHNQLRKLTGTLGRRMEFMETDGSMLIVHIDANHPALVSQVAAMPGVTMLPAHHVELSGHHIEKMQGFGIEKGDTVHAALNKVHARHPHAIANTSLPIY